MKTREERDDFIHKLETIKNSLYTTNIDTVIEKTLTPQQKQLIGPITSKSLSTLMTKLESLPVVDITLAIEPTVHMIKMIHEEISESKGVKGFGVLLDIHIDPKIIGGVQFGFEGKYKDYSVLKQIQTHHEI